MRRSVYESGEALLQTGRFFMGYDEWVTRRIVLNS